MEYLENARHIIAHTDLYSEVEVWEAYNTLALATTETVDRRIGGDRRKLPEVMHDACFSQADCYTRVGERREPDYTRLDAQRDRENAICGRPTKERTLVVTTIGGVVCRSWIDLDPHSRKV